jgi:ferric iron reductase protein FhuF
MTLFIGIIFIIIGVIMGRKLTAVRRAFDNYSTINLPLIWNNPVFVLIYWLMHWVFEVSGIVLVVVYFV